MNWTHAVLYIKIGKQPVSDSVDIIERNVDRHRTESNAGVILRHQILRPDFDLKRVRWSMCAVPIGGRMRALALARSRGMRRLGEYATQRSRVTQRCTLFSTYWRTREDGPYTSDEEGAGDRHLARCTPRTWRQRTVTLRQLSGVLYDAPRDRGKVATL